MVFDIKLEPILLDSRFNKSVVPHKRDVSIFSSSGLKKKNNQKTEQLMCEMIMDSVTKPVND